MSSAQATSTRHEPEPTPSLAATPTVVGTMTVPRGEISAAPGTGELPAAPPAAMGTATAPDSAPQPAAGSGARGDLIGRPGEDVLALAFEGGAFDTAMQFGVIHALLATNRRAPDVVVGVSAGAINGVVLAEVLQAGSEIAGCGKAEQQLRRHAQERRFRECLEAFQNSPDVLVRSILPDGLEINAAMALEPVRLPIHFETERKRRREAVEARAGMTQLMNHLLAIRMPFSVITLAVRRLLGIQAAGELPSVFLRYLEYTKQAWGLWCSAILNCARLTPLIRMLIFAAIKGRPQSTSGASAQTIAQRRWRRALGRLVVNTLSFIATLALLILAPLLVPAIWLFFKGLEAGYAVRNKYAKRKRIRQTWWGKIRRRILSRFGIADSFGQTHVLRTEFVRLFDPAYYGKPDIRRFVNTALRREDLGCGVTERASTPKRRALAEYGRHPSVPIHVVPIAARLDTGQLEPIPGDVSIVDGLLAATACVPVFPAVTLGKNVYIDAMNVGNEPTSALMELLRERVNPNSKHVFAFPVSPLPISKRELADRQKGEHFGSVSVVGRVMQLRRFRDAGLEYRVTELYTNLVPGSGPTHVEDSTEGKRTFVRAHVRPIEPDEPLDVNERLSLAKTMRQRRALVLRAVADGCRATLERVLKQEIRTANGRQPLELDSTVSCYQASEELKRSEDPHCVPPDGAAPVEVANRPASPTAPPGLPEVCAVCAVHRGQENERPQALRCRSQEGRAGRPEAEPWTWPPRDKIPNAREALIQAARAKTPPVGVIEEKPPALDEGPPTTTLVLSGGVFRGVFQVGVLNGLSEARVQPTLIAGASVGSIMAGMAANVFATKTESDMSLRHRKLLLVSTTFLALDRLILTDRFADAVRGFTLRAAASNFSLRDLDLAVRRYDKDAVNFGPRTRRVLAGLEQLIYVSPFEFVNWVKASRERNFAKMSRMLRGDLQEFLVRIGIGDELLGSEPLALLIDELVLGGRRTTATFDSFRKEVGRDVSLITVATNLTQGRLETISGGTGPFGEACLREALLASSAFPFVFRPRKSWEIFTGAANQDQYVDGGVMDNLPLDAVVEYLNEASAPKASATAASSTGIAPAESPTPHDGQPLPTIIPRHPKSPHLVIAASLEVEVPHLDSDEVAATQNDWYLLGRRAKTLGYNRKLDGYAKAQRHFRALYQKYGKQAAGIVPVNIEVVTIKPKWLCGTFAFHPMLGFRRQKQAESIAHGCASTLATLWRLVSDPANKSHIESWKIEISNFDKTTLHEIPPPKDKPRSESCFELHPKSHGEGACWFRKDAVCPFSRKGIEAALARAPEGDLPPGVLDEAPMIYAACGRWQTHARR